LHRAQQAKAALSEAAAAQGQQSIRTFFGPLVPIANQDSHHQQVEVEVEEEHDEEEIAAAIALAGLGASVGNAAPKYDTIDAAIVALENSPMLSPSRNAKEDRKRGELGATYLQVQATFKFLQYWAGVVPGHPAVGKMIASAWAVEQVLNVKQTSIWGAKARSVRQWASHFLQTGEHKQYVQGQYVRTFSIITVENVKSALRAHLREMRDTDRTPLRFMQDLNNDLLQTIEGAPVKVGLSTARRWMKYLDFNPTAATKGWYTDGHERADVVEERIQFLADMVDIERRSEFLMMTVVD
jgi:hypothetical protein